MRPIIHTCHCTGQRFTCADWGFYIMERKRWGIDVCKEVVCRVGRFEFNVMNVCINPHTPAKLVNDKCYAIVQIAQSTNGRWSFALDYSTYEERGCSLPGFLDTPDGGYDSDKAATLAALAELRAIFSRKLEFCTPDRDYEDHDPGHLKPSALAPYIRNMIHQMDEERRELTFVQQELF